MEDKIFILGLDGATFDLIKPWASQGKLPAFSQLLKEGTHADLKSVPNANSAPAWVSFATGQNPGKHGIFYFDEPILGTYNRRYLNGSFRKSKAVWNYLSDFGKESIVINVPMTYPAEKIKGCMISGLDSPGFWTPGFTHPPSLAKDLHSRLGEYIIEPGIPGFIKAGKKEMALKRLFDAVEKRFLYTKELLKNNPWNLFIAVFTAIDTAQHFFWKDMEPSSPGYNEKESRIFSSAILQVYQKLDSVVSNILERLKETTLILVSDHGGGFNQRGAEYLNTWLSQMGFLTYKKSPGQKETLVKSMEAIFHFLDRKLSRETKLKLVKLFPGVREKVETASCFKNIDWTATQAFSDGARDEIRINLRGREPQGTVKPGEEYEKLRDVIIGELLKCRDIKNGKPVVRKACKREEIYWGKHIATAPDISVQWNQDFVINGIESKGKHPSLIKMYESMPPPLTNGGHRENGILLMHGPSVKKGCALKNAEITDVAPTVLNILGLPIPEDLDGRPLIEALEEEFVKRNPPKFCSLKTERESGSAVDYSPENAKKIAKTLKDMGYID